MFEKIYESATKGSIYNKEIFDKNEQEKKEEIENSTKEERIRKEASNSKWEVSNEMPLRKNVFSEELLDIIISLDCKLLEYGKRIDDIDYYEEYDPTLEYYSLEKNNYKFIVKNFKDVDIPEGIFAVYNLVDTNANKEIDFYLDLGCRNTGDAKKEDFILLLNSSSEEEFLINKYQKYINIPNILKDTPFEVIENKVNFASNRIKGYYKIDEDIFIVPYDAWFGETRLVITNDCSWDVNSSNDSNNIGYYLNKDILDNKKELLKALKCFKKHLEGNYGYLEGDKYYKTNDITKILNKYIKTKDGKYTDIYNHHYISFENLGTFDGRGYGDIPYINIYEGLELAKHFTFTIDSNARNYDINSLINFSDIVFKYDKKEDENNCILLINNYQYNENDDYSYYDEDEADTITSLNKNIEEEFKIDSIEFRGTFTECKNILVQYIDKMLEIFNLKL